MLAAGRPPTLSSSSAARRRLPTLVPQRPLGAANDYGVDVSVGQVGGVFKRVLKEGTGTKSPQANSEVVVHYVGTLLDGTKFDSSRDRDDPFKFTLGQGSVIKGWDEGVASMRKGEVCVLTCTPEYAYGERGSPPKIPANATLQFEVELISWSLGPDDLFSDEGAVITDRSNKGDKIWFDDDYNVVFAFKSEDSSSGEVLASAESFDCKIGSKSLHPVVGKAIRTMTKGETAAVQVNETYSFSEGCQPSITPSPRPIKLTLTLTDAWKEEDLTPGADKGKVVKIKTVTQGKGWQKPTDSCSVEFKISIASADGTVLHAADAPVSGHIGLGELPEAYELALQSMKQGTFQHIRKHGGFPFAPHNVPSDQPLMLTIELVSMSKGKESYSMNHAEKLEAASLKKERANAVFKTGNFKRAKVMYDAASKYFSSESKVPSEKESANALKLACNLNGAQCCIKTGQWKDAAKLADDCLAIDRCNLKALYRRGFARLHLGLLVEAETDIAECERLSQNSAEFAADIARAQQLLKAERAKIQKRDKQVFSKLFSGAGSLYADAPPPAPAKDTSKPSDSAASDSDD